MNPSAPEAHDAKNCSTLAGYWLDGWVAPEPIAQRLKAGRFGLGCILGFMAFVVLLFRAGVFWAGLLGLKMSARLHLYCALVPVSAFNSVPSHGP